MKLVKNKERRTSIRNFIIPHLNKIDWTVGTIDILKQLQDFTRFNIPSNCSGNLHYKLKRINFGKHRFCKKIIGYKCWVCGKKSKLDRGEH